MKDEWKLGERKSLPEELKFLTLKYPREIWEGHVNLAGTGEVWLNNHHYFRQLSSSLDSRLLDLQKSDETTLQTIQSLLATLGALLNGLDGHHRIEDDYYFPKFAAAEPRLLKGFEILDEDHNRIHEAIDRLTDQGQWLARNFALKEGRMNSDERFAIESLAQTVQATAPLLLQHLDDEEDLVIPLILERSQVDPEFG